MSRFRSRRMSGLLTSVLLVVAASTVLLLAPRAGGPARAATDPVIAAAGDIACDPLNSGYNAGLGTATDCREKYTAALLAGVDNVLALGDLQYACGGLTAFQQSYDPTWGLYKAITKPVPGNHEYQTSGGTGCSTNASGYYSYFGSIAGDPTKGYYAYDLGAWRIYVLNSNCSVVSCAAGSTQEQWLRGDLAGDPRTCVAAIWHHPRFSDGTHGNNTAVQAFWQALYDANADVVLSGHDHDYQRSKPQHGVTYVVSGGGAKTRETGHEDFTAVSESIRHYVDLLVYRDRLVGRAIDQEGHLVDSWTIRR